jgi:hypothetical protein
MPPRPQLSLPTPGARRAIVIGAGSFGTAVAVLLARGGFRTTLQTRTPEQAARLEADRENHEYLELDSCNRPLGFFNCWTRKEAFVKGRGEGLSLPLPLFEVSVNADEPAPLLRVAHEIDDGLPWALTDIDAPPGYIASLATAFGPPSIRVHDHAHARTDVDHVP